MLVSNLGQFLILCPEKYAESLLAEYPSARMVLRLGRTTILGIEEEITRLKKRSNLTSRMESCRYLDRFYFWTPDNDPHQRQEIIDIFFELISEEYELIVDIQRNIENIQNLLVFLRELMGFLKGLTIVDYGCGTGLSTEVTCEMDISLVGIERSPKMRHIAAEKGMKVWGPMELALQPLGSIAGVFASYVLDLLPNVYELQLIWERIRVGGVLVANFHKNRGILEMADFIKQVGGLIQHLVSPPGSEKHGLYIAYIKI